MAAEELLGLVIVGYLGAGLLQPELTEVDGELVSGLACFRKRLDLHDRAHAQLHFLEVLPGNRFHLFILAGGQAASQLVSVSLYSRFAEFQSKLGPDVNDIPDLLRQGKEALDRSDSLSALKAFGPIVQLRPENPEGWSGLGNAYSEAGESDQAIEAFKKAVELDPQNAEYFLQLGREQLATNQNEDAQQNLMHGLLLAGKDGDPGDWYNLALCLYHQNKPAQAVPFCRSVLEMEHAPDSDAQQLLANCLYDIDAFEEAAELYQKVLTQQPDSHDSLVNLGFTLEILGRQEEAIPILEKAVTQDNKNRELYAGLSRCYAQIGKADESQAAAKKYNDLPET